MKHTIYIMLAIVIGGVPLLAYSDDTEIHLGNSFSDLEPNVIFIMDTSGSMAWSQTNNNPPPTGEESRLDVVKRIAIDTINKTQDINIGLMSFSGGLSQRTTPVSYTPLRDHETGLELGSSLLLEKKK